MELDQAFKEILANKLKDLVVPTSDSPTINFPNKDNMNPKYYKLKNILSKKDQFSQRSKYSEYHVKEIFRKNNLYRYVSPLASTPFPEKKKRNRQDSFKKKLIYSNYNENETDRRLKEKIKNPMSKMATYTITEKKMFFTKRKELIKLNAIEGVNFYIRRDQNDEDRYNYDVAKSLEISPSKRLVVLSKNKYSNSYFT